MNQRYKLPITTRVPRMSVEDETKQIGWKDGPVVEMEFELTIDIEAIKKLLGRTAAFAKTGKSREMNGLVIVKRINPK